MRNLLFIFFISASVFIAAQEDSTNGQNLRLTYNNHFGFSLGGPGFLGYYFEHYFNHNWSLEAGIGSVLVLTGAYAEGRYYFGSKDKPHKYTPYLGLAGGVVSILGASDGYFAPLFYAPVGFQIFNSRGFAFSMEAAVLHFDGETFPMGALRFRMMKKKEKRLRNHI
jgi:hypothetical protein